MVTATTLTLFIASIQRCRHHKRGGAAFGRAPSFVASFVLALNRVNIVAVTRIPVLHVGVIGHHVPRHEGFMFPRRSGNARLRARGVQGQMVRQPLCLSEVIVSLITRCSQQRVMLTRIPSLRLALSHTLEIFKSICLVHLLTLMFMLPLTPSSSIRVISSCYA